jgi:hypothetical protein
MRGWAKGEGLVLSTNNPLYPGNLKYIEDCEAGNAAALEKSRMLIGEFAQQPSEPSDGCFVLRKMVAGGL